MINELKDNEVFVFGSNLSGFHGAGAAGLACRGDSRNTWREDKWFAEAMKSPVGSPARIGKWAIFGQATGFQIGREGKSYAIVTIVKGGHKRSYPVESIANQVVTLFEFAKSNQQYNFLFTAIGAGLAGYTNKEMRNMLDYVISHSKPPENIIFASDLYI